MPFPTIVRPTSSRHSPPSPPRSLDVEEDIADYAPGGYLNVKVGEEYRSPTRNCAYKVIRKLGWGHFSTVWLIKNHDDHRYAALKVCSSKYGITAKDEIALLMKVRKRAFRSVTTTHGRVESAEHPGSRHIISLLDYFSARGRFQGEDHICMVFEPLGENLLNLLDKCRGHYGGRNEHGGLSLNLLKTIGKQVLMGLQFLHDECGLVHTDIKPENILVGLPNKQEYVHAHLATTGTLPPKRVVLSEARPAHGERRRHYVDMYSSQPIPSPFLPTALGNGSWNGSANTLNSSSHSSSRSRSRGNFSSLIVQISDLGNATPVDRHYTEDIQTRQYRSPEAIIQRSDWGFPVDIWSVACMLFELATGDYLFDPRARRNAWEKDDDHMAQIIELCGDFDLGLKMGGRFSRDIFNSRGALRHIHTLKPITLPHLLAENYRFHSHDAKQFAAFLGPMLRVDPELRATAAEMMMHEWLGSHGPTPWVSTGQPQIAQSYEDYEWTA
ncbi:putative dis1-suppressing protein kinase dsk1 [Hysterangium stoloniferum]|nr:putative dis1-suppressing protein kinase dsk1 [Hysterangium stoloniferum]